MSAQMSFNLSLFNSKTDTLPKEAQRTWTQMCARLEHPVEREAKDGTLFSPAVFRPAYRLKENVTELSLLILDYDHHASFEADLTVWRELGCCFAAYTTHSHRRATKSNPQADERFRVVVPLAAPIPAERFPALWKWAARISGGKIDAQAQDSSRMYYTPAIASSNAPYQFHIEEGDLLDWCVLDLGTNANTRRAASGNDEKVSFKYHEDRNAELCRRIMARGSLNSRGNYDARCLAHNGKGATALVYFPKSGAVKCNDLCSYDALLVAEGLPAGHLPSKEKANPSNTISITPARWFADRFPALSDEFGEAILEQTDKKGIVSARDMGEDFFAASLGDKGCPDAPTVFVPTEDKFYTYSPDEGIFIHKREPGLLARLSRLLLDCARECVDGCDTQTLEFQFRDSARLSGVIRKARGLLEVPHDFFSTELTEFIPCANGMLRLSDKALLPFSPSYRRRNKLAVSFESTAKCPLFLDTLMRPALEEDELDLLQRWCGLALVGENLAQKLLILTGTAGGGKGTFVRVLNGIIGQVNLASLRPQLLGERFELGRFLGKTLLYGADVPENFLNQRGTSVLKSLTGHDPVTLEFKNSNESPFIICKFNVIVTCNSRLTVQLEGDTEAWRRRLAIVDYHRPKPEHVIADLDQQILTTEAPGVLNWMLEGLDKLRADGWRLHLTGAQQASVDNLLLESDSHALFVREELEPAGGRTLTVPDCFTAYVEYCNGHGWKALTRNKFGQIIGDMVARQYGITVRHDVSDAQGKAQRGWYGIQIRAKFSETD